MMRTAAVVVLLSVAAARDSAGSTATADEPLPVLRARAFEAAYNLDYPEAVRLFDQALARYPNDSATHRARAIATWLHIVFRRGSVTVDQYMGGLKSSDVKMEKPLAQDALVFQTHADKALALAERRLASDPQDLQALYDAGAALAVLASYSATVEGRVAGAFRQARRAFDAHERVMSRDPRRKDAGLVVGTYRYLVSTLSLPMRWMAYLVGFGGDRAYGIRLVEDAARYPSDVQTDAKVALILLYNREGRFKEALSIADGLISRYPKNRIIVLEAGATAIRAGLFARADRVLSDGLTRFADDRRPRAFGEEAMWYYKRGLARVALRNLSGAASDLERAQSLPARGWVKARIRLEQGKLADLAGRREQAREAYRAASDLATATNDPRTRREAERLRKTPYR
jgi:tetratricopeptide (TPR) repeat protein